MKRLIQLAVVMMAACFHVFARHRISEDLAGTGIDSPALGGGLINKSTHLAEMTPRLVTSTRRVFRSLDSPPAYC